MFTKFWNWLNREDWRERYPDGRLVLRGPWVAVAVVRLLDGFPLWLQRLGGLFLRGVVIALLVFCCWKFLV